jgi:hypothetical protein
MHAMVLNKLRTPLVWTELPDRQPGAGQIRVKVTACGVCRTDLHVVDGERRHPRVPIIPGHEIVGRIDAMGPGRDGLTLGERVGIPWLGHTCGVCERLACGMDDADLDLVVPRAREAGKACRIHGATRIMLRIGEDLRLMAAPVLAAKEPGFDDRVERVLATLPDTKGDLVDPAAIASMMQAGQGTVDNPHRLVMDLHKRLNALQAAMAQETLDGAAAYDREPADRPMVSAFMTGVNRTARLKFNHSGLATTATRAGGRLVIQNDIGTTDAMSSSCMCRTGLSA